MVPAGAAEVYAKLNSEPGIDKRSDGEFIIEDTSDAAS
jgi:hypothetical protein